MNNSKVLVTGGAGFIGSHLIDALIKMGCDITVVDNLTTGKLENIATHNKSYKLVVEDIKEFLAKKEYPLDTFDFVFHLAGSAYVPFSVEHPEVDFRLNLENTLFLLEELRFCQKKPKLLFPSSAAVYGNPVKLPVAESDITIPVSPYGVGKLAAERYINVYCSLYKIRAVSLRLFSVYGTRHRKQVVYDLFVKLHKNPNRIEVHGDGTQTRDFINVRDVTKAMILLAVSNLESGEAVNIASGHSISIDELVRAVGSSMQVNPEIEYFGHVRPGDVEHWRVDVRWSADLGMQPTVSLSEGLNELHDWFVSTLSVVE